MDMEIDVDYLKQGTANSTITTNSTTSITANSTTTTNTTRQICSSTVMKMDIKKDMFLVGDVFMRKFYTIFDRDNNRVGLARARTSSTQASLSEQSKLNSQN